MLDFQQAQERTLPVADGEKWRHTRGFPRDLQKPYYGSNCRYGGPALGICTRLRIDCGRHRCPGLPPARLVEGLQCLAEDGGWKGLHRRPAGLKYQLYSVLQTSEPRRADYDVSTDEVRSHKDPAESTPTPVSDVDMFVMSGSPFPWRSTATSLGC